LDSQEKTMLVEGVMKRELRELRIASRVAPLLAAVALVGCAAHIHVPFVPGDKLAGPALVVPLAFSAARHRSTAMHFVTRSSTALACYPTARSGGVMVRTVRLAPLAPRSSAFLHASLGSGDSPRTKDRCSILVYAHC
jgi:hypothetical protein